MNLPFKPKIKKLIETIIVMIILMIVIVLSWEGISEVMEEEDWYSEGSCNVSNVKLQGYLITYISNEGKDEEGNQLWDETASENIIKAVAENRNLDIEKVRQLADGSTMLGQMALENNLIDKIGGRYEVKEYLREKLGGEIKICR